MKTEDKYRMLVSNLCWAVEEKRRIEIIKSIRHLTGCGYGAASDIHAAFTNFPRDPSPMPEAELRKSLSPNASAEASKWAADYVQGEDSEPTMADMKKELGAELLDNHSKLHDAADEAYRKLFPDGAKVSADVEKLRAWVQRDNDEEPSPLPQGTTEYLVITRDKDNNTEAFCYYNKTEAYEAAKAENRYNDDTDVCIAQVIAVVDTTPYIREV